MSHVVDMDVHVLDLEALAATCKFLGTVELVRNQKNYKWYGTSVGDYPLPAGFTAADLGKCDHAIRVVNNGKAYEVGVVKRKDGKPGYQLIWDFWAGGHGLQTAIGKNGGKLIQEYSLQVATKDRVRQGYRVTRTTQEDGTVLLRAVR